MQIIAYRGGESRMKTSENIIEISKAMNLAQREMRPAIKDSTNPHFRSKYSDLASVMDAIREPIGNNGLSIWQDATLEDLGVSVTTRIVHISGQWVEFGPLTIPIGKRDAHAVGSACSYGKRYALCAALGVVSDDDDDGNKAVSSYDSKSRQNKYDSKSRPNGYMEQITDVSQPFQDTSKTGEDPIKYINKSQLKMFNEKYDQISSPSSEYYDKDTAEMIDQSIVNLNIEGFPSMDKMQEKDWIRFMKSFDKFFDKKKV